MNNIEEILWNYIDGNCTPDEQKAIGALIEQDEAYRAKYAELLLLNKEFSAIELDEPPMAFTYNVMEGIRAEQASVPLKATVNKRIIWGIAIFFVVTISVMLVFAFASMKWSAPGVNVNLPVHLNLRMPSVSSSTTKMIIEGFVFFDAILALYLLDAYLRKKIAAKHV